MMLASKPYSVEQYKEAGFTGPVRVFNEPEAAAFRQKFFQTIGQSESAPGSTCHYMSAWHHTMRWAYDLATDPRVLDLITPLLGPDLIMWAMHFWYKEPRSGKLIPWHQDAAYWQMEPKKNVTAWIALGPTFLENGCLRVIPGSHKQFVEHIQVQDPSSAFKIGLPTDAINETSAVTLEMQPGEAVIFNEGTYHGSRANESNIARVALSIRYTTPDVKFLIEKWKDPDRIKTFLVRGQDTHHHNDAILGGIPQ